MRTIGVVGSHAAARVLATVLAVPWTLASGGIQGGQCVYEGSGRYTWQSSSGWTSTIDLWNNQLTVNDSGWGYYRETNGPFEHIFVATAGNEFEEAGDADDGHYDQANTYYQNGNVANNCP